MDHFVEGVVEDATVSLMSDPNDALMNRITQGLQVYQEVHPHVGVLNACHGASPTVDRAASSRSRPNPVVLAQVSIDVPSSMLASVEPAAKASSSGSSFCNSSKTRRAGTGATR